MDARSTKAVHLRGPHRSGASGSPIRAAVVQHGAV